MLRGKAIYSFYTLILISITSLTFGQKVKKSVMSISILGLGYDNKYFSFYTNGNLKSYSTNCMDSLSTIGCSEIYNFTINGQITEVKYGGTKEFYTYNLNNQLYKQIIINNNNDTTDIITHFYDQKNRIQKSTVQGKSKNNSLQKYDTTLLLFYTFQESYLRVSYFDNTKKDTEKIEKFSVKFNSKGQIIRVIEFDNAGKTISTFKIDKHNNTKGRVRYYNADGSLIYTKNDFINPPLTFHQSPFQEKFLKTLEHKHYPGYAKLIYQYY